MFSECFGVLRQCLMHVGLAVCFICACSNVLHILRPAKAPGFAYAWLELVSHRIFVGRVLAMTAQQRVRTVLFESELLTGLGTETLPIALSMTRECCIYKQLPNCTYQLTTEDRTTIKSLNLI